MDSSLLTQRGYPICSMRALATSWRRDRYPSTIQLVGDDLIRYEALVEAKHAKLATFRSRDPSLALTSDVTLTCAEIKAALAQVESPEPDPEPNLSLPMRRCVVCGKSKPIERFYRHRLKAGGRDQRCIACTKSARMLRWAERLAARAESGESEAIDTVKRCSGCGQSQSIDAFARRPDRLDGRDTRCKACKRLARAERTQRRMAGLVVGQAKQCDACGILRRPDEFSRDVERVDGLARCCRACRKADRAIREHQDTE